MFKCSALLRELKPARSSERVEEPLVPSMLCLLLCFDVHAVPAASCCSAGATAFRWHCPEYLRLGNAIRGSAGPSSCTRSSASWSRKTSTARRVSPAPHLAKGLEFRDVGVMACDDG
jgi:hypothetical protein